MMPGRLAGEDAGATMAADIGFRAGDLAASAARVATSVRVGDPLLLNRSRRSFATWPCAPPRPPDAALPPPAFRLREPSPGPPPVPPDRPAASAGKPLQFVQRTSAASARRLASAERTGTRSSSGSSTPSRQRSPREGDPRDPGQLRCPQHPKVMRWLGRHPRFVFHSPQPRLLAERRRGLLRQAGRAAAQAGVFHSSSRYKPPSTASSRRPTPSRAPSIGPRTLTGSSPPRGAGISSWTRCGRRRRRPRPATSSAPKRDRPRRA
jgi:hypothetical protein